MRANLCGLVQKQAAPFTVAARVKTQPLQRVAHLFRGQLHRFALLIADPVAGDRNFANVYLLLVAMSENKDSLQDQGVDAAGAINPHLFVLGVQKLLHAALKLGIFKNHLAEPISDHIQLKQEFLAGYRLPIKAVDIEAAVSEKLVLQTPSRPE